ncbi:MAG: hypothetical protein RR390_00555 [Hafnia sp.]
MCQETRNWSFLIVAVLILSMAWGYQSYIGLQIEREKTKRVLSLDKKQMALATLERESKRNDVK